MFQVSDFEIFDEPTLTGRMQLIKTVIDPKFAALAPKVLAQLAAAGLSPSYAHIAKHLRRYKNPPTDTWVAFSQNKRGYKQQPHLEIGFWPEYLFVYADLLDEAKEVYLPKIRPEKLTRQLGELSAEFVISNRHTSPEMLPLTSETAEQAVTKLVTLKHSELVVGRHFLPTDPLFAQPAKLEATILETVASLAAAFQN